MTMRRRDPPLSLMIRQNISSEEHTANLRDRADLSQLDDPTRVLNVCELETNKSSEFNYLKYIII